MNKKLLSALFIIGLSSASYVNASDNLQFDKVTLSAGYAQMKIEHLNPMHGASFSFRQELNQQLGIIATVTYAQNEYDLDSPIQKVLTDINTRYYSVMAGPTLRLNDFISVYGVAGVSQIKFKNIDTSTFSKTQIKKNAFSWGAGLTINPIEMLSISVGYENSRYKMNELEDNKLIMDGFITNIGYRF